RPEPVAQPAGVLGGREHGLGVPNTLGRKVFAELNADAAELVRLPQHVAHVAVLIDEVVWSVEPPHVVRAERRRGGDASALRELADGPDTHRALQVDVEFGLREGDQISHRPMVASAEMPHARYTYGDTTFAADRLDLVATVFEPTSLPFMRRAAPSHP